MTIRREYGVRLSRSTRLELERHTDAPRRQPWRTWAEQQAAEGSIAVDLFAGAGGLSHGLEAAGYTVVLSVDHDPMAIETHLSNFPGPCLDLDLAEPDRLEDLLGLLAGLDIDLIAGGPPCQPFSRAGRSKIRDLVDRGVREALDPRRELWRAFLRVAEEVRPRAVLMENVPDMALGDDMRTVRYMAERLERLGYETDFRIIEAWRYGVPQHRQRLMFVALRDGVFEWPKEVEPQSVRDAIGDLPRLAGTMGGRDLRYRGPKTEFQVRARAGMPDEFAGRVFDHMTRAVRDDDIKAAADGAEAWAEYAAPSGLELSYHIHTNLLVDSVEDWKTYMSYLNKAKLCIDVSHAQLWGYDPVESLRDFQSQLNYVHLQDYSSTSRRDDGYYLPVWVDVGQGQNCDFPAIKDVLEEINFKRWVTACPGEPIPGQEDPISEAKRSKRMVDYLRGIGY